MNELAKKKIKDILDNQQKIHRQALVTQKSKGVNSAFATAAEHELKLARMLLLDTIRYAKMFEIRSTGCECREPRLSYSHANKELKCLTCGRMTVSNMDYEVKERI